MNLAIGSKCRGKVQANAEFLKLDRDGRKTSTAGLGNRVRKFAASQEAGFFSRRSKKRGLRQNLQNVICLEGLDCRSQINIGTEDENIQEVAEGELSRSGIVVVGQGRRTVLPSRNRSDVFGTGQTENIDSELIQCGAVYFRETDLQHNLSG